MLNENRFLGTFRGHNTRTNTDHLICSELNEEHVYFSPSYYSLGFIAVFHDGRFARAG